LSRVCVVIPIHSSNPTALELSSFKQCFSILRSHSITVLAPKNLNLELYREVVSEFEVIFIDPIWQSSLAQYNKLKVSGYFYKLFKSYQYLLTYELDGWVFKDELEYWCNKNYEYIGAPWFEGWDKADKDSKIVGVGNSGFSLRSVPASIRILKRISFLKRLRTFWFKNHIQAVIRFSSVLSLLKRAFKIDNYDSLNWALVQKDLLEDFFWSQVISKAFSDYKVGSISDAIKFSFEVNPAHLFKLNEMRLPFGCHAWDKHDPKFWEPYIPYR
jgi:hypothetical protein